MQKTSQNTYKFYINSWVYVAKNSLNYLLRKSLYLLLSAGKSVYVANYSPGLSTGAKPASLNLLSPLATLHEKMKVSGNINRFTLHEFGFWQHKLILIKIQLAALLLLLIKINQKFKFTYKNKLDSLNLLTEFRPFLISVNGFKSKIKFTGLRVASFAGVGVEPLGCPLAVMPVSVNGKYLFLIITKQTNRRLIYVNYNLHNCKGRELSPALIHKALPGHHTGNRTLTTE